MALSIAPAQAAPLTYDADTTVPANDGTGVWDITTANWYNGSTDGLWSNSLSDTAIFGAAPTGTGGTVTVGTVNVGTIQFNPQTTTGYTLAGGTITLSTGITTTSSVNSTISSILAGTNGLVLTGVANANNAVTLSGANTYTGVTTVTNGRFTLNNATAFGSTAGATASALGANYTQVNAGTTVQVSTSTAEAFLLNGTGSNTSGALRLANGVTLSSFVQLGSDTLLGGGFGASTISGNVDLAAHTLSVGNGSNTLVLTLGGLVTNAGPGGGLSIGGGSGTANGINLTNTANTYVGTTTMNGGLLGLGGDTVLGSSTLNLNGTLRSTNATGRTIANTLLFGGDTVFGATSVNTGTLTFTNTATTSIGNFVGKTFTTNVDTTFNTPLTSGTGAPLVKAGPAALILNGVNTFAGTTTVSAGTLAVNGSIAATSAVTVAAGAVLTGAGTVAGTVTDGGTINAGGVGTVGALATGAETFSTGSSLVFDFGNGTVDALTTSGILTGLNNATLTFTQLTGSTGLTQPLYTLVTASSFASGTTLPTSATTPAGYQLQLTGTSLNLVQTAAAPEPSQCAAFGIGLLALGGLALRSRRRSLPAA